MQDGVCAYHFYDKGSVCCHRSVHIRGGCDRKRERESENCITT